MPIAPEYVDVEARLKALNDQRDRLNALADKAETTADLLEDILLADGVLD